MDQQEINHRLEGSNLGELQRAIIEANKAAAIEHRKTDPYGAHNVAKQITEREMVNHPDHYQGNKMEVIDIIEDYELGFNLGNTIKYVLRADKKGNKKQDLQKAMWYLERELSKFKG
jgi:hypothetical protein